MQENDSNFESLRTVFYPICYEEIQRKDRLYKTETFQDLQIILLSCSIMVWIIYKLSS